MNKPTYSRRSAFTILASRYSSVYECNFSRSELQHNLLHPVFINRQIKLVSVTGCPNLCSRNGEGDYKCSQEEVKAMFRDAAAKCTLCA
ncbi:MAG: hypothetical protein PUB97_09465 [Ruminococcus sp.]|nr:hypothetical protein [Ruminococcus sp.]